MALVLLPCLAYFVACCNKRGESRRKGRYPTEVPAAGEKAPPGEKGRDGRDGSMEAMAARLAALEAIVAEQRGGAPRGSAQRRVEASAAYGGSSHGASKRPTSLGEVSGFV